MTGGSSSLGPTPPPPRPTVAPSATPLGPGPHGPMWRDGWGFIFLLVAVTAFMVAILLLLTLWSPFGSDDPETGDAEQGVQVAGAAADGQAPSGPAAGVFADGSGDSLRCPVMTDSIDRLYLAFFERQPDEAEFSQWVNRYRAGEESLETIAQQLADSDQFEQRYGELANAEFVNRIYRNSHGTEALEEDLDVWTRALDSGRPRGAFVVAITETQRAVDVSRTTTPMAGFLRHYPLGTHWYCGTGPQDDLPIKPLADAAVYADYMFHNGGNSVGQAGFKTVVGSQTYLTLASGVLPPGVTSYRWNGQFSGDGNYGSALDVEAGQNTWWVMVFYPNSIGDGRLGWEIDS